MFRGAAEFQFFVNGQLVGCGSGQELYKASNELAPVPVQISWKIPSTTQNNVVALTSGAYEGGEFLYVNDHAAPTGSATIPFFNRITAEVKLAGRDGQGNLLKDASGAWQEYFCKLNGSMNPVVNGSGGGGNGSPLACAAVGKKPLAGQACCAGLVKDALGICNLPKDTPPNLETCVGTYVCSVPDMYLYAGIALVALMMLGAKR
jgi:hypothetical protein